ncbi:MAG: YhcB family protein [Thalassotalea sp.]|nr:YhcB family protein [Thalassotalea sp.]
MTVVMPIIYLLIGAVIGFVASKFLSASEKENKRLSAKVSENEAALTQYQNDVAEHLDSSAKLLEQMNATCQTAMKQMEQSTALLQRATPSEADAMPFFSQETQEQLARTVKLRHSKKENVEPESITEAPLDYSGNPSGLFDDKKQSVTNAE